jgi:hypothetical protein
MHSIYTTGHTATHIAGHTAAHTLTHTIHIDKELRAKLKRPLGKVVSFESLEKALKQRRPTHGLIAVGDVTGKRLMDAGIRPWIWIYDGIERRERVKWRVPLPTHAAVNPHGMITGSMVAAIKDAFKSKKESRIYVKGEEDLAGLCCIAEAPVGAVIVYGQPRKGVVVVPVNRKKKDWARTLLSPGLKLF